MSEILVVAGEPSGDRAAARVLVELRADGVEAFGMAGDACEGAGLESITRVVPAMGLLDVVAHGAGIARAMVTLRATASRRRPRVALLVNYTEFNAHLGQRLKALGTRVVWYAAPQIWAWRAGRARGVARALNALAVILPFEERVWRELGVDARYVGHPSFEAPRLDRAAARAVLGLGSDERAVAVMPGSRAHEVTRLLEPMLAAIQKVGVATRVLLSGALNAAVLANAKRLASRAGVPVHIVPIGEGATRVLAAFDVALCASGTASLEAAALEVPPVVAYKLDPLAALAARVLVRTPYVALPNIVLGRLAFPELLQDDANAEAMARALARCLDRRDAMLADCNDLARRLGTTHAPSSQVADMVRAML